MLPPINTQHPLVQQPTTESPSLTCPPDPTIAMNMDRDMYDKRSVEQILKNPLFSEMQRTIERLWDRDKYRQAFYGHVGGDWTDTSMDPRKRADIAANAERILQHIDKLGGSRSTPYNYHFEGSKTQIDRGPPHKDNTTTENSEARRLLDFCDYGFSIFTNQPATPHKPQRPTHNTGRDAGDHRTAEEIKKNPLFNKIISIYSHPDTRSVYLLRESTRVSFFNQIGGNWNDNTLSDSQRADIAANAERVLKYINSIGGTKSIANDQVISGTKFRRLRPNNSLEQLTAKGSEAWHVLNFANKGYSALP